MGAALTERHKSDRAELAERVAGQARRRGLAAVIVSEEDQRRTLVTVAGLHALSVTVTFDGRSPHAQPDTYVLSWHMPHLASDVAGVQLNPDTFGGNVNRFHGHKSTDVVRSSAALLELLERRFSSIADGSAFVKEGS